MLNTQEKQKYCNILKVGLDTSQEEITKAYRKLALKYHPDRNRGNEIWAKEEFIKVGEAYSVLSGKEESGSSNRFSSDDEFRKFEEMLKEVERKFNKTERKFNEYEENINRGKETAQSEAIRKIEEDLVLSNVSISELDSSLWSPYGDWKEKIRNSVGSSLGIFSGDMRIAINKLKWAKVNNSSSGQGHYSHGDYSWKDPQQPKRPGHGDNPPPNFSDRGFPQNNGGRSDENKNKSFSTSGDKIAKLEDEIEWNKQCLLKISDESEKQKCQKIIARLEKELSKLRGQNNSSSPNYSGSNSNIPKSGSDYNYNDPSPSNFSDNSREKDEKINKLENEIQQLKKDSSWWSPRQRQENQKKITKKEQELSDLKESNRDNNHDDDWYNEWDQEQLSKLFKKLRSENKIDELAKKVGQLEKVIQQLVKEIQELKTEVKELREQKEKGNISEYQAYYLSQQESQLGNRQSKFEQLKSIIDSNSNSNFPTGWVIGGGIIGVVLLMTVLIIKNKKRKKIPH